MGRVHLDALDRARVASAVAVVEPVEAARAEVVAAHRLDGYASIEELLAAGGFDAVLIAAPSDLHGALVARLAAAGVPVLCEKPCGLRAEEARATAAVAAAAGVLLQVGYWRRFVPELVALGERIAAGELGELSLLSCWQWDAEPPSPAFRARSGGIAIDMGVHELDQIRWLSGAELVELQALPATSAPVVDGDPESAEALVRLSSGALATVSLGRRFPHGDCCWVEAMGSHGHERLEFMWGAAGEQVFHAALAAQADAFAEAVAGAPPRGATAEDARAALEAAERMGASIAERLAAEAAAP
jgi:myo-inositol 2-dehydrogenase/D-chiro-inositol 1-dehydrogenase